MAYPPVVKMTGPGAAISGVSFVLAIICAPLVLVAVTIPGLPAGELLAAPDGAARHPRRHLRRVRGFHLPER